MKGKYGNTDSYNSEPWILKMFEDYFDPCPYNDNPEQDGLSVEWEDKTYINPPYSKPLPWIEKAIEESNKGKIIVMLLRVDTSTKWFAKIVESKAQILWINGRLRYRKNSYKRFDNTPVPWASMLVIFNGKKMRSKILESVKRKMVKGHDNFCNYYCIHIDDWDKIERKLKKKKVEDEK